METKPDWLFQLKENVFCLCLFVVFAFCCSKSCKSCKSCKFYHSKRFFCKITVKIMFDSFLQGLVGANKMAFRLFKSIEDLLIKQSQKLLPIPCNGITNN